MTKHIFVTGGVVSSLGKGLTSASIGMLLTIFVFISLYMWWEGRENWKLMLSLSAGMTLFSWILFDQLLSLPWPRTILGTIWPALKTIVPSM